MWVAILGHGRKGHSKSFLVLGRVSSSDQRLHLKSQAEEMYSSEMPPLWHDNHKGIAQN